MNLHQTRSNVLNVHALAPEILMYDSALVDALADVDAAITDTSIECVITELLSKPHLLEFVLSGKSGIPHTKMAHVLT